jgi:magnesium chelatase family protein
VERRPLRAPHHTVSASGLVGGGSVPRAGEVSLAHRGILLLDELSEFARAALDALRQPLEDGRVAIVRGQRTVVFPSAFMLVATTNPCPCGLAGTPRCRCGEADFARHRRRLSGPLLDRIDLLCDVQAPSAEELSGDGLTTSATVRAAVAEARERQAARLTGTGLRTNAQLTARLLRDLARVDADALEWLRGPYATGALSARGHHRVLRVARTVADLAGSDRVSRQHVRTALSMRRDDAARREQAA